MVMWNVIAYVCHVARDFSCTKNLLLYGMYMLMLSVCTVWIFVCCGLGYYSEAVCGQTLLLLPLVATYILLPLVATYILLFVQSVLNTHSFHVYHSVSC